MPAKTLVLGLDGADHTYISRMNEAGELPNFSALSARSACFEVENDPGMGNVQFWTSAAIGAGPAAHGHYFYMQFDPRTYDILPDHDLALPKVTPFWAALDDEGRRISITDWYEMPVTPIKNGVLIHRWFAHEPLTESVFIPPEMAEVAARYADKNPIAEGFASRPRDTAAEMQDFLSRTLSRIPPKAKFFADQLSHDHWDLYVACMSEAHNVGHYYTEVEDEGHARHDPAIANQIPQPLRQCYRELDTAVGEIVAAAGEDAEIFLLGGPAMGRFISANSALEEIARRIDLGFGTPLSGAEAAKKSYRSLIPEQMRRKIGPFARAVRRRFANREYLRRRFFAVPHNDNSGAIRVNLKGREKYGTVSRGSEYEALLQEITDGVSSFINPDTGRSIVKRVIDTAKEFDGPNRDMLPDIFIEWDRTDTAGDFTRLVSDSFGEVTLPRQARTGDHTPFGFFWTPPGAMTAPPARPENVTAPIMASVRR